MVEQQLATFIRRGEVLRLLGITRYQLDCMVGSGYIKPFTLSGMKQKVYRAKEIMKIRLENEN
jgi:hypothetical protein